MNPGIFENVQRQLENQESDGGLTMSAILTMPPPLRRLVNWMLRRRRVSQAEIVAFVGEDEATAYAMLDTLMGKGIAHQIKQKEGIFYDVRIAQHRGRTIPSNIWQALEDKPKKGPETVKRNSDTVSIS